MKRILYIEPAGNLWGSEKSLALLLNHLDTKAFKLGLCLPPQKPMVELLKPNRVQTIPCIQDELHKKNFFQKSLNYIQLYKAIRQFKPDLIHLNQAGFSNVVSRIATSLKIPLIVHVRLDQEASLTAKAYKRNPNFKCIAISQFTADQLIDSGIPSSQVHTITNPISLPDNETLPVENLPSNAGSDPIVGFVGRLTPDKGVHIFIQAAKSVCQRKPNTQFWIIGDDGGNLTPAGNQYNTHWKQQVAEDGLNNNIHFLGFRKNAAQIMRSLTLLAMPSTAEPWGRVLAEAMSIGTPVIASDSGASQEIIQHETSGLLFPAEQADQLAQAIERLLNQPELCHQFAIEGKRWITENCSPTSHTGSVTALYHTMLSTQ